MSSDGVHKTTDWVSLIRTHTGIQNEHGLSNEISTTKYTLLTWLPKSIWEQFRRVANLYFLLISILMLIGTYAPYIFVTPLEPFSTIFALLLVLMVTSLKVGYEDLQRARSDKDENTSKATVVRFDESGSAIETVVERKQIQVGDIVKLQGPCVVPVDMVIFLTSFYTDGNQCYVETANIDGETNLKLREAPAQLKLLASNGVPTPELFSGRAEYEPPNKIINSFVGALHLDALSEPVSLGKKNILLRSSKFSNTEWGYGVAVYAGNETKIQMCSRHAPFKLSKIEGYVNRAILMIFCAQITLVTISVICIYALGFENKSDFPYLFPNGDDSTSVLPLWLEQWFVFFLLYNNFIPISLYVTIELVNLGQAYFIWQDHDLYDEVLDMPCVVRSSNLAQELGLVSNIFSDKTGTLTRNEMKFVQFVVDGKMHHVTSTSDLLSSLETTPELESTTVFRFFLCLSTCHTVIREKNGTYRAESPDELALIEGAGNFHCGLLERGTTSMLCEVLGRKHRFDILAVNSFSSRRKRMSILIRDVDTRQHYLMCKGADNMVLPLCATSAEERAEAEKSLLDLSCLGLRTLCIAWRVMDEESVAEWLKEYTSASHALKDRSHLLSVAAEKIESNMTLLGITAVEDRLQDEVPEVIADLSRAGIVLWMLTGDKEETAINIGHSCNLLEPSTQIFFLTRVAREEDYNLRLSQVAEEVSQAAAVENASEIALVMDGDSFKFFDEEKEIHRAQLLAIGKACRSVIACRLTPDQKKQLVRIVKKDTVPRAITLAIGDGANDVSMIMEADVGVGIFGKEGRQAANNADFAVGQFKFLRKLLLVHGRWNYCRQSKVFLYSMHKNMVLTLSLFWFSFYAAMSGTSMYESWVYNVYNFALGLPIIFFGILDRDLSADFALQFPQVYKTGLENVHLNMRTVGAWILNASLYAVVFCLLWFVAVYPSFLTYSVYEMGTTIYVGLVFAMHLKVSFMHHIWNQIHVWSMAISVGGLFLFLYVLNSLSDDNYDIYYTVNKLYSTDLFWFFGFFSVPIFCVLIDVITHSCRVVFWPTNEQLYREAESSWNQGNAHLLPNSNEMGIEVVSPKQTNGKSSIRSVDVDMSHVY